MLAKLDNLGPFQFFFTLSCADSRWDENFSSTLRKLGVCIEYVHKSKGLEKTFVKDSQGNKKELEMYLKEDVDSTKHELLRTHVLNATRNYHQRVKAFITKILTDKNNPMCVEYWTTKVEFQGRGAAHNHGTIWVDMKKMEFKFVDDQNNWTDFDDFFDSKQAEHMQIKSRVKKILRNHVAKGLPLDLVQLKDLFDFYKLVQTAPDDSEIIENPTNFFEEFLKRFSLLGLNSAFKKFQTKEELLPHEENAIIEFANKYTTCTLNVDTIRVKIDKTVEDLAAQIVKIVTECNWHRHTRSCRKYDTICRFGIPKFPSFRTLIAKPTQKATEDMVNKYKKILNAVKDQLCNEEVVKMILEEIPKELDTSRDMFVLNREKRINRLLSLAGLKNVEERSLYEEALQYSSSGYSIILERDLDEIWINSYNPEWVLAWNGNTDIQVCLDFFAIITYITEYFMKEDTGMMEKLTDAMRNNQCDTLKEKMSLLMNSYISARQMGEVEAMYKIFPNLRLKDSNVTTQFVPTSRKENRSKMLQKIDENENDFGKEKKKIDGREGWYVEKYDLVDKYTRRDETCKDLDELSFSQFWKMCIPTRKEPKKKNETNFMYEDSESEASDTEDSPIDDEGKFNYVMVADSRNKKKTKIPQLFKLDNPRQGEPPFMKKRNYHNFTSLEQVQNQMIIILQKLFFTLLSEASKNWKNVLKRQQRMDIYSSVNKSWLLSPK